MEKSVKELTDGITSRLNHPFNTSGNKSQHTFITHHFSKQPNLPFQRFLTLKMHMFFVVLEIQSQLIIFHQLEILLKTPLLEDSQLIKKLVKLTSTLMVQGEETMKLWQEELSQILESSTNQPPKQDLKQPTFLQEKQWTSVMQLSSMANKENKQSSLQVQNMVQDLQEIGLLKDHISWELSLSLLNLSKESTEATQQAWEFSHQNSPTDKQANLQDLQVKSLLALTSIMVI